MENVHIRRLKIEDAEEITRIYEAITRKPTSDDFIRVIEDPARRSDGACFVAEMDGKMIGTLHLMFIPSISLKADCAHRSSPCA